MSKTMNSNDLKYLYCISEASGRQSFTTTSGIAPDLAEAGTRMKTGSTGADIRIEDEAIAENALNTNIITRRTTTIKSVDIPSRVIQALTVNNVLHDLGILLEHSLLALSHPVPAPVRSAA